MPLVRITAKEEQPVLHGAGDLPQSSLDTLLSAPVPVVIMVHGYKFLPDSAHCPFETILAPKTTSTGRLGISWPRHLGVTETNGAGIAFGWSARGSLPRAYAEAARAGKALASLMTRIAAIAPGRPISLVTHSLGARVYLEALRHLGPIETRAILMAGAEFTCLGQDALQTPAGRLARVLNVTSRENDLFDFLFELRLTALLTGARALGQGLDRRHPHWCDLQIDSEDARERLAALGFRIAPPARQICHWFPYMRPGVFPLYRAFLAGKPQVAPARLSAILPKRQSARWSRLFSGRAENALPPGPVASI
ncbi:Alpha/beta hydrolase of unknown function [Poseidonocella pacifica]|uniref:Alpha/beta hydrolase family protein n=1 Tax=Poseidonocella pacifica TaxID=871651 RepID=A0A1I0V9K1_9RHOB|nr:alpha/beta hydrolase [Poseidonocella pacifica]SFA72710.1 Alpha/beta hydrolase of unknown function [Poseidonocella pacifica]